ncbi:MAG: prepilin-type N-terminal cleavage/methylation domain-containing protein [Acidobacteriota bacterium]|nr:MAG: prepilin-type N-terminal cleavage/methylation domain-containing protein [Acidobacteriota bacterium]
MCKQRGFTLVESLAAMLLLALVLLSVAPMFVHAVRTTEASADFSSVGVLAVERMELLRASGFKQLTAGGSLASDISGYFDDSHDGFSVRWRIQDNASPPTMKLILVRATALRQIDGRPKQVTLTTVRAK